MTLPLLAALVPVAAWVALTWRLSHDQMTCGEPPTQSEWS